MAQAKVRPEQKKSKKKHSMVILNNLPESEPAEETAEPSTIWKEEVEALLGQKFKSMPVLIDTIADRVCDRLGEDRESNLHEFIVVMLDTDEEIRQELSELFEIKNC